MLRKTFDGVEVKAVDGAEGVATMIVSVFGNVDAANEIVVPGFFSESLATRRTPDGRPKVKGVWGHDWSVPVAKTLDARELLPGDPLLPAHLADLGGLWVQGQFNLDTQRGREAFSDLRFGSIDEFSIGYSVTRDETDDKSGVTRLIKGDLYEWSPVLVGMNDATVLLGAKGHQLTFDEHSEQVRVALAEWMKRAEAGSALRRNEGRSISEARKTLLSSMSGSLTEVAQAVAALLEEVAPAAKAHSATADVMRLRHDFERMQARIARTYGVAS